MFYGIVTVVWCFSPSETTQIENPRTQWRQEQERMLKEYLVVAQEALNAKKEMYQIKQQRLELVQQEMQIFNQLTQDDNRSITSCEIYIHAPISQNCIQQNIIFLIVVFF